MLIALDVPHEDVEIGELLVVVTVYTANIVKDVRENLRNLVGGRLVHYEQLIQSAAGTGPGRSGNQSPGQRLRRCPGRQDQPPLSGGRGRGGDCVRERVSAEGVSG